MASAMNVSTGIPCMLYVPTEHDYVYAEGYLAGIRLLPVPYAEPTSERGITSEHPLGG